ncbi:MAG: biotin transporter BioY [Chloroflexaceae bacterium]|nr:biotin transporter BioY [Chloroflexaceae bacterium]
MSAPNEFLWALVGLLLTIAGTFIEIFITNPPWQWAERGLAVESLGITSQIGAVLLTGCIAGRNAGAVSQVAYVILGLFWLPIFAQGGGLDYFREPSFGYLLGFIPGAWLSGWLAFRQRPKLEWLALSALAGLLAIHLCGIVYLAGASWLEVAPEMGLSSDNLWELLRVYSSEPIPGQIILVCFVAVAAYFFRKLLFY